MPLDSPVERNPLSLSSCSFFCHQFWCFPAFITCMFRFFSLYVFHLFVFLLSLKFTLSSDSFFHRHRLPLAPSSDLCRLASLCLRRFLRSSSSFHFLMFVFIAFQIVVLTALFKEASSLSLSLLISVSYLHLRFHCRLCSSSSVVGFIFFPPISLHPLFLPSPSRLFIQKKNRKNKYLTLSGFLLHYDASSGRFQSFELLHTPFFVRQGSELPSSSCKQASITHRSAGASSRLDLYCSTAWESFHYSLSQLTRLLFYS